VATRFFRPDVPTALGVGLDASGSWGSEQPNFPNGCHICEVEIDPETGAIDLVRYTGVDDIGRVINPMICEGQMHGSLAQGIGQALLEHVVFDEAGQNLTGSFMDYAMPRADHFPDFNLQFHEVLCTTNPIGLKAVGEVGTVGGPAAVVSAVRDALKSAGGGEITMPATGDKVWELVRG
jgi:carbon-monoxide dehydrogenase large subunit